jgi:hypothetical protein
MVMVQHLFPLLPEGFTAEPRVHLGSSFEIDVCAYGTEASEQRPSDVDESAGGVATATWAPPQPTMVVDADLGEEYAYEVLIFDQNRGRHLVAAVEIVSPANKDRPEHRRAFVTKCTALVQKHVCVSLVDLVTIRHFNLYAEMLDLIGHSDLTLGAIPPGIYAATCRYRRLKGKSRLECWAYPLVVGQPLPKLPIWLADDFAVSLDLETTYEETCRFLHLS